MMMMMMIINIYIKKNYKIKETNSIFSYFKQKIKKKEEETNENIIFFYISFNQNVIETRQ